MDNDARYDKGCCVPCDALNLKENILGESCNLDGRPCRLVLAKELGIHAVDGDKIVHVLQKYLSPQYSGWGQR